MSAKWKFFKENPVLEALLSRELDLSPLTARLLVNRGVDTPAAARSFLNPRLADLSDPLGIPQVKQGAERVLLAARKNERVMVFGDYDVDGVTGTAILLHTLKELGIDAAYYIPHRYEEGYSMSGEAVKKIAGQGVSLIITVDCGISNFSEVEEANRLGIDVIITDHHNLPERLPDAFAIINPKMISGGHPARDLSGAGVAFKFAWALLKIAEKRDAIFLTSLLDLAALGTISDVVPLNAENRILASAGLNLINKQERIGLRMLLEAAAISGKIGVRDIYFGLAPRLNAAGRLEHASHAVDLLLAGESEKARDLAQKLNKINIKRQGIGGDIKEDVFSQIDPDYIKNNRLVFLAGNHWHAGVIGIVASQVTDRFCRPAVLVSVSGGVGRGSARSVDGVNIFNLLEKCRDLFIDFGGHAGAAGFEVDPVNIPELEERLQKAGREIISDDQLTQKINIDAELLPGQITLAFIKELETLDPHGEGNPAPVFCSKNLALIEKRAVGAGGRHLKAKFSDGKVTLDAIGFGMGKKGDLLACNNMYNIAYELSANVWDGFESAQLSLVDIQEAA